MKEQDKATRQGNWNPFHLRVPPDLRHRYEVAGLWRLLRRSVRFYSEQGYGPHTARKLGIGDTLPTLEAWEIANLGRLAVEDAPADFDPMQKGPPANPSEEISMVKAHLKTPIRPPVRPPKKDNTRQLDEACEEAKAAAKALKKKRKSSVSPPQAEGEGEPSSSATVDEFRHPLIVAIDEQINEIMQQVPVGKKALEIDEFRWVASHLDCKPEEIIIEDIPSRAALSRWRYYREQKPKFWDVCDGKLLTAQARNNTTQFKVHDGRDLHDVDQDIREAYERATNPDSMVSLGA